MNKTNAVFFFFLLENVLLGFVFKQEYFFIFLFFAKANERIVKLQEDLQVTSDVFPPCCKLSAGISLSSSFLSSFRIPNCSAALGFGCGGRARLFLDKLNVISVQGSIKLVLDAVSRCFTLSRTYNLQTARSGPAPAPDSALSNEKLLKMSAGKRVRWKSVEVGLVSRRKPNKVTQMPVDHKTLHL